MQANVMLIKHYLYKGAKAVDLPQIPNQQCPPFSDMKQETNSKPFKSPNETIKRVVSAITHTLVMWIHTMQLISMHSLIPEMLDNILDNNVRIAVRLSFPLPHCDSNYVEIVENEISVQCNLD